MPKLSFIVPVYNTEKELPRCLDSLLDQSFSDFEILLVDDGSTDGSFRVLQEYQKRDPKRIRLFQKENSGLSDTRNTALDHALGEFVAFVDSDDFIDPRFAEKLIGKAEEEGLDMVLMDFYYYYGPEKKEYGITSKRLSEDPLREALISAPMACVRICRRILFDGIRFCSGILYEDLEILPRLLLKAKKVGYLPEALYYYYQRTGSIMHRKGFSEKLLDIFTVLDSVYNSVFSEGKLEEFRDEIEFLYIEHLLRSAGLRFAPLPNGKELVKKLSQTVSSRFPRWRKNPYFAKVSPFFKLAALSCGRENCFLLTCLAKLKG